MVCSCVYLRQRCRGPADLRFDFLAHVFPRYPAYDRTEHDDTIVSLSLKIVIV